MVRKFVLVVCILPSRWAGLKIDSHKFLGHRSLGYKWEQGMWEICNKVLPALWELSLYNKIETTATDNVSMTRYSAYWFYFTCSAPCRAGIINFIMSDYIFDYLQAFLCWKKHLMMVCNQIISNLQQWQELLSQGVIIPLRAWHVWPRERMSNFHI